MFRPYERSPLRILSANDGSVVVILGIQTAEPAVATPTAPVANGRAATNGGLRIQVYPLDDV